MRSVRQLLICALWGMLAVTGSVLTAADNSETGSTAPESLTETSNESYLLRFKFEPGQEVRYEVKYEMAHTSRKGTTSETAYNTSTTMKHYRVDKIHENENAELVSYIDGIKMKVRFNDGEPLAYDSDADGVVLPQFRRIANSVGVPLARTIFAPTGNVVSLTKLHDNDRPASEQKPVEAASAEQTDKSEASADEGEIKTVSADKAPVKAEKEGDEDDLNAVANYLVRFPEEPVKIDEIWEQTYSMPVTVDRNLQQQVRLQREYRLRSVEDGIAHLTFRTSILSVVNNPMISSQLIQNTPSGTIDFDIERGLIVKRTAKLDNTEFGFSGDNSSMRAVSTTEETLVGVEISPAAESVE